MPHQQKGEMLLQRILNGKTVMYLLTKAEKADENVNAFLKSEFQKINKFFRKKSAKTIDKPLELCYI